jgi:hypothetical protein
MKFVSMFSWHSPELVGRYSTIQGSTIDCLLLDPQTIHFLLSLNPPIPLPPATPLKIHKLTRAEMVECQLKGLFYNCDDKYFPGHKCKEQNLFMAMMRMFLKKRLLFHLWMSYHYHIIQPHPLIHYKLN